MTLLRTPGFEYCSNENTVVFIIINKLIFCIIYNHLWSSFKHQRRELILHETVIKCRWAWLQLCIVRVDQEKKLRFSINTNAKLRERERERERERVELSHNKKRKVTWYITCKWRRAEYSHVQVKRIRCFTYDNLKKIRLSL